MGAKPDCFNRVFIGGRSLVRTIHFAIMSAKITWAAANACMASLVGAESPSFIAEKMCANFAISEDKSGCSLGGFEGMRPKGAGGVPATSSAF